MKSEQEAREAFVAQLVEVVRPALPALSGRIVTGLRKVYGPTEEKAREDRTFAERNGSPLVGFHVAGQNTAAVDFPDADSGNFVGRGLWLLTEPQDGERMFLELTFSGRWSSVGREDQDWTSSQRALTLAEAARGWSPKEILASIHGALLRQRPEVLKSATSSRLREAEVLNAVTTVLQGLLPLLSR